MFLHVINKSLILLDKQSKRTSYLDGVIAKVTASTMLEYMDDNVEVSSSSGVVIGSQSPKVKVFIYT
jgi:hypothetical protein